MRHQQCGPKWWDLERLPAFLYEVHPLDAGLEDIAALFNVTVLELRNDNRSSFLAGEKGEVVPGQILRIRNRRAILHKSQTGIEITKVRQLKAYELPVSRYIQSMTAFWVLQAASAPAAFGSGESGDGTSNGTSQDRPHLCYHHIQIGETLEGLSKFYGVSVMDLRRFNRDLFPTGTTVNLRPGMAIRVFVRPYQNLPSNTCEG